MIVTAKTIALKDRCGTVQEWLRKAAARKQVKISFQLAGTPVTARIDHGRWIADCECRGAEYVDPDEPIFFCLSCMNTEYQGQVRPVQFPAPEIRAQIEAGLTAENYYSWNEREEPYGL